MFSFLSQRVVEYALKRNAIKSEDKELYLFAYQLLIANIITVISLLIISLIFGYVVETLIFIVFLFPLRIYAGGFHQRTQELCYISTVVAYTIVLTFVKFATSLLSPLVCILAFLSSSGIIILLAPLEDPNKPLSTEECRKYKITTLITLTIELVLFALAVFFNFNLDTLIFMALAPVVVSVLLLASFSKILFSKLRLK